MRNHIFVKSRKDFKHALEDITEQQVMSGAFISIHTPGFDEIILEDSDNILNLTFHDSDEESFLEGEVLFNEDMSRRVHEFILKNHDAKFWLIHCTAGKCRSGAVGEVLSDYFEIPYHQFKRDNPQVQPNILVKKLLTKTIFNNESW